MSLGRSSRFCSLASLRWNLRRCYLPLHLHPPSPFIMVVSCVTGPLTRMLVKPWWLWKCSSSWEHAQALRVIIGTNWDCPRFFGYAITTPTVNSLSIVGFFPSYQNHSQHLHFVPSLHRQCAILPWVSSISGDKQIHPLRCLQQGNPHHPSPSMPFYRPPPNDRSRIVLGWFKEFQWSLNQK